MYRMTDDEFEAAIEEALQSIPPRFLKALENIELVMQDEPDPEQLEATAWELEALDGLDDSWEPGGPDLASGREPGGFNPVDDHDPADHLGSADAFDPADDGPGELFGLYEGIALTERDEYGYCEVPDVITIFKGPHERCFDTREEVVEEIGKTVIHEIGHYFGLDDEKLYAMGY